MQRHTHLHINTHTQFSPTVQYMQVHNTHIHCTLFSSQRLSICRHTVQAAAYSN
ncbi:hypothetical protein EXN66_Car011458 [Channa argus]|uniref:Uncharacterized protein n=1 Tax=Channa argus TaxID=215402 RepID=A0A6G1PZW3_CHAAH|nr:hypothetical protein EXN66_Car011458 [Channa argus]